MSGRQPNRRGDTAGQVPQNAVLTTETQQAQRRFFGLLHGQRRVAGAVSAAVGV